MSDTLQPQEVEIEVPASAFVNCPKGDDFPLVSVKNKCATCEFWEGFFMANYGNRTVPFKKQYSVRCTHPVSRQIIEVII